MKFKKVIPVELVLLYSPSLAFFGLVMIESMATGTPAAPGMGPRLSTVAIAHGKRVSSATDRK